MAKIYKNFFVRFHVEGKTPFTSEFINTITFKNRYDSVCLDRTHTDFTITENGSYEAIWKGCYNWTGEESKLTLNDLRTIAHSTKIIVCLDDGVDENSAVVDAGLQDPEVTHMWLYIEDDKGNRASINFPQEKLRKMLKMTY